jgi:diacylglycerol kinase (ATP)
MGKSSKLRATLIHNPGAGGKGGADEQKLVKLLRRAGYEVRYQSSKDDDWKKALKKPADLMVVAGGDGTVGRVTRRMVGRGVPIALLPCGTANNIARTLGLVERPFEELVKGWPKARRVRLDVGIAQGPWGERFFVEGVGAGLFARLLADSSQKSKAEKEKKKKKLKPGHVVDNALERLKNAAVHATPVDVVASLDGKDISGSYVMLEAVNLKYVGPNLHLAPDSAVGDGNFDVVMVAEAERERLIRYLDHWQDNPERLAVLPSVRGKHLKIEWTGFPLHIDDKLRPGPGAEPEEIAGIVEARINGAAVEFLVPA